MFETALLHLARVSPPFRSGIAARSSPIKSPLPLESDGHPSPIGCVEIVCSNLRGDDDDVLAAMVPALRFLARTSLGFTYWATRTIEVVQAERSSNPKYDDAVKGVWAAIAHGDFERRHVLVDFLHVVGPELPELTYLADTDAERALHLIIGGCEETGMHENQSDWRDILRSSIGKNVGRSVLDVRTRLAGIQSEGSSRGSIAYQAYWIALAMFADASAESLLEQLPVRWDTDARMSDEVNAIEPKLWREVLDVAHDLADGGSISAREFLAEWG